MSPLHQHADSHSAPGGHGRHHSLPGNFGRAFLFGTLLNIGFVGVEVWYGIGANSVALLADAGHNLSDVLGLLIAWIAATLSRSRPTTHYTYGLRRTSIFAALINAIFLLIAIGAIGYEAIGRLTAPQPVKGNLVVTVAAIGIVVNGVTAWLFASGRNGDINVKGAFLHMAADAAVSAGVVISGLLIAKTGWLWLDPATSLTIVIVILVGTWGLLRDSLAMSLDRVPESIAPGKVNDALAALPGVTRVHDLHVWSMSTTEAALTCRLVMPGGCPDDNFLHGASAMLNDRFRIGHATIQVERADGHPCALQPPM